MKKNKKFKFLSIIALSIVLLLSVNNVSAEVSRDFVQNDVKYNLLQKWEDSSLYYPGYGSGTLRLYMYHVKTSKTDPCTNCKFTVRPIMTETNATGWNVDFKMGDNKAFLGVNGIGAENYTYHLEGARTDWTLQNLGATIYGWFNIG